MTEYQPTEIEKKVLMRFTMEKTVHTWTMQDKIILLAYLNKKAGLPFGTINLLRTESENWKTKVVNISEIPYASRQTTVELAANRGVSTQQMKEYVDDQEARYTYRAILGDSGRFAEAVGSCALIGHNGNPLAATQRSNKIMHAETKAKRRATLEVCGLAFIDEAEVESIEGAVMLNIEETATDEAPKSVSGVEKTPVIAPTTTTPTLAIPTTTVIAPTTTTPTLAIPTTTVVAPAASVAHSAPAPKPAAVVSTPSLVGEPYPARYAGNALFQGADTDLVGDAAHIQFIVKECTEKCGWAITDMSKWLVDTFGVTNQNKATTLTLSVFKRVMTGVDTALVTAGVA